MVEEGERKRSPIGRFLDVAGVLASYGLEKVAPGRGIASLISALDAPSEDASMAAYMALVKLGPRNTGRLLEAARRGEHTASALKVLGDLGDRTIIDELTQYTDSTDPEIAAAARDSIEALQLTDD